MDMSSLHTTTMKSHLSDHCADLASPNMPNFFVALFILIGLLVSYLPQHFRIINLRSSEGISPYWVLLGETSMTCALANMLALPASRADLACCKEISGFACFAGVLGILQVSVQWACFTVIVLLFLLFFPRATALAPPNNPKANPSYSTAVLVVGLSVAHAFIMALTNMIVVAKSPDHLQGYSSAVGVLAAILASIQYLPQIYTTWSLGRAASLSIPMMCLQTPGGYLWAGSQAVRLGWAGWSVWGILLVTATMQGILLIMAIFFELKIRRGKTAGLDSSDSSTAVGEESNGEARENDEETPLIGNER